MDHQSPGPLFMQQTDRYQRQRSRLRRASKGAESLLGAWGYPARGAGSPQLRAADPTACEPELGCQRMFVRTLMQISRIISGTMHQFSSGSVIAPDDLLPLRTEEILRRYPSRKFDLRDFRSFRPRFTASIEALRFKPCSLPISIFKTVSLLFECELLFLFKNSWAICRLRLTLEAASCRLDSSKACLGFSADTSPSRTSRPLRS